MKAKYLFLPVVLAVFALPTATMAEPVAEGLSRYVDQYIGTSGNGHVFLGANVPFGMVQLGPTQHTRGWDWCSGYHYSDSILIGFGHTHLSGTGIGDLGDIGLLPVADAAQREVLFSHEKETVVPGYYAVELDNPAVRVELTATKRVGFHRYTFLSGAEENLLLLDLNQGVGWDRMTDWLITQESPTRITGMRRSEGWSSDQRVYFVMDLSQPVAIVEKSNNGIAVLSTKNRDDGQLLVKVAISAVDIDKAKMNMAAELPGWDFDATATEANQAWDEELARIEIETGSDEYKRIFYTAMYHFMIAPSVFCDVDGEYRGPDKLTHKGNHTNYTTFSLWDTYRAAHPLFTLIFPEMQGDFAETFLNIYDQQGRLPVWHLFGNETDCMVGNPGVIVLADLVLKGLTEDNEKAYEALRTTMLRDERSLGLLREYGYIPWDKEPSAETVAKALEYCAADDGVARVAQMLGKTDDYEYFSNRSKTYAKYFDKDIQFMRAVGSDGTFRDAFDPIKTRHTGDDYTEGNSWQYTWLVPHDVHGLVDLFGSEEAFINKLDELFVTEGDMGEFASPDISGLVGQYAHGNEPSHHIAYLYNYVGQPWKSAKLIRHIMHEMYTDAPDGLCGNEDVGQMSAWYIMSALGLYQVEPSGGKFIIGTPLYNKATVNVGNGKTFTVTAKNNSDENIYVQKAVLNGSTYAKSYIDYKDITAGGELVLTMGSKPSKWGTKVANRP